MSQKVKLTAILSVIILIIAFLAGCGNNGNSSVPSPVDTLLPTLTASPPATTGTGPAISPDTKTTASVVNSADAFKQAIGTNGTWIICPLNDLTLNDELVLEGEFKNGKKDEAGNDVIQRKIALYTQDQDRNITDRFTLTAPKLTIKSPNASIQHGTFKGDLYVSAENFQLVDATVEGNVYFTNKDVQASFKMDDTSKVTGVKEVKEQ